MNHAVLGTGMVGKAIASKLVSLGHSVRMGARTSDNPAAAAWATENGGTHGTFAQAAAGAEIVWNCTNGQASLDALGQAGAQNLAGKVLIDIANPLDFSQGFPPVLSVQGRDSLGEQIQRAFPEARVVKTLNTMNCQLMVDPTRIAGESEVFVSGNDAGAKSTVVGLLKSFGWTSPIDLGDISSSRGTEAWLPFWVRLYGALGTPDFNLKLVRAR